MERKFGLAHLCHHSEHFEYCYDFDERKDYIRNYKPKEEIEKRLKYFKIIPIKRLPEEVQNAVIKEHKATEILLEKDNDYEKTMEKVLIGRPSQDTKDAKEAYAKAYNDVVISEIEFKKALKNNITSIMKLHNEMFPDCPWNEEQGTMFPKHASD